MLNQMSSNPKINPEDSYKDFFQAANGFPPYPYQEKFQQRDRRYNIHALMVPTGLGKTECFTVDWLWGICNDRANTPSRLVISLPMRTLTHQTFDRVSKILHNLKLNDQISCHKLVGGTGEPIDRSWCDCIDRPAIIIGTQDQIISRQLFKGYATSRWEWSMHAALLNNDVRIVVDETQLQGVSYQTSVILQKIAAKSGHFGQRELILCSATLDPELLDDHDLSYKIISLSDADRANTSAASTKINFNKQLHQLELPAENYVEPIAQTILAKHTPGTLSICIVNRVKDAMQITKELIKNPSNIPVKLLHARFRGYERDQLCQDLAGFQGIIISTQVIEAGIDLDAQKLFTMPCPWASFVQRCGRGGRKGIGSCDIYLLNVADLEHRPYDAKEIKDFWKCFNQLQQLPIPNANISTLLDIKPPAQPIGGNVLEAGLLLGLFDSHPRKKNSGEDVSGYIRDSSNPTLSVMWREFDQEPDQNWRYRQEELCRIPVYLFQKFHSGLAWIWHDDKESWERGTPGNNQIVLLPQKIGGYSSQLGFTGEHSDSTGEHSDVPPLPVLARGKNKGELWGKTDFVTLTEHSIDAYKELNKIAKNLSHINLDWPLVADCAQWHDLGKAHPQFQNAIDDPRMLAKAQSMRRYQRRGFRHELASAVGALINGKSFLFAYIVAAHHGKIRVKLSNFDWLQDEYWLKKEQGIHGLVQQDQVPNCSLGDNTSDQIDEFKIDLKYLDNWKNNVKKEIDNIGVFKLSYLETLVRIADRRASKLKEFKS
jgi:CRISPR-associated endonuclease/helicase Cas3